MSNLDTHSATTGDEPLINWQYLWMIGTRHWKLFFGVCIPIIALTFLYLMFAKPLYESTAVVQVEQQATRPIQSLDKNSSDANLMGADAVATIEQNMQGYELFLTVVKSPGIADDPNFMVGFPGHADTATASDKADWLRANTKIAIRRATRLIDVTVTHRVPEMTQKLSQALVDNYISMGGQSQKYGHQATLKLLQDQAADIKMNLQTSMASLETYKELLALKTRLDDQNKVIDGLQGRYREKHPQMIQARSLLQGLEVDFDKEFQKTISKPAIPDTASLDDRVSNELKLVTARSEVLQKEVDTESNQFDNVLRQMHETDVIKDTVASEIHLEESPVIPSRPSKPHKTIIMALGIVMGIFLGLSSVVAVHAMESTIETPMEAESALGLPVLGTILRSPKSSLSFDLAVVTNPGGATAEGFRSLRAVINLLGKPSDHRTILFTSALPGEGKTFVSCNYAVSLAQTGLRTLLIDADLRRPEVHNRLKIENNIGLVEVINQDLALSQAVHVKVAKYLDVLTAGGACTNPAELLAGEGFKAVVQKALASYDRIVFDTGPVNLVSDCLLIAPEVNSVVLVLRAGHTSRQAPRHAVSLLRRAHKDPAGLVLNAIKPGSDRMHLGYKGRSGVGSYGNVYSA